MTLFPVGKKEEQIKTLFLIRETKRRGREKSDREKESKIERKMSSTLNKESK